MSAFSVWKRRLANTRVQYCFQIQISLRTLQPQKRRRFLGGGNVSDRQDSKKGQKDEYLAKAEPRNHFVPPSLVTILPAMIYRKWPLAALYSSPLFGDLSQFVVARRGPALLLPFL